MKALILTGPHDGELTDHDRPILEIIDPASEEEIPAYTGEPTLVVEPAELKILTYKRVIFSDGEKYVSLFVPNEWPITGMQGMVLNHLIRRAFKDAEK